MILFLITMTLLLSLLFVACSGNFEKIEISENKIEVVATSMRYVKQVLDESTFDTAEIENTWIQNKINVELHSSLRTVEVDSVERKVRKEFVIADFFPFAKSLHRSYDGTFRLNDRLIGKDKHDFDNNILICREFDGLTLDDRKRFIESVTILLENHIWGFQEFSSLEGYGGYRFDYSEKNLYINRWQARYLYVGGDAQNDWFLKDGYIPIDKKDGLELYKLGKE